MHKKIYNNGYSILSNEIGTELKDEKGQDEMDKSLEYLMKFLYDFGYSKVVPSLYDVSNSKLSKAMDKARGGHWDPIPKSLYPKPAWYTNYDETFTYKDHLGEIFILGYDTKF